MKRRKLSMKQKRVLEKGQAVRIVRGVAGNLDHLIKTNGFVFEEPEIVDKLSMIIYQLKAVDQQLTNKSV